MPRSPCEGCRGVSAEGYAKREQRDRCVNTRHAGLMLWSVSLQPQQYTVSVCASDMPATSEEKRIPPIPLVRTRSPGATLKPLWLPYSLRYTSVRRRRRARRCSPTTTNPNPNPNPTPNPNANPNANSNPNPNQVFTYHDPDVIVNSTTPGRRVGTRLHNPLDAACVLRCLVAL